MITKELLQNEFKDFSIMDVIFKDHIFYLMIRRELSFHIEIRNFTKSIYYTVFFESKDTGTTELEEGENLIGVLKQIINEYDSE